MSLIVTDDVLIASGPEDLTDAVALVLGVHAQAIAEYGEVDTPVSLVQTSLEVACEEVLRVSEEYGGRIPREFLMKIHEVLRARWE